MPVAEIVADPVARVRELEKVPHPRIPLPVDLFGEARRNSRRVSISPIRRRCGRSRGDGPGHPPPAGRARPLIGDGEGAAAPRPVTDPSNRERQVGQIAWADSREAQRALEIAHRDWRGWNDRGGGGARRLPRPDGRPLWRSIGPS